MAVLLISLFALSIASIAIVSFAADPACGACSSAPMVEEEHVLPRAPDRLAEPAPRLLVLFRLSSPPFVFFDVLSSIDRPPKAFSVRG